MINLYPSEAPPLTAQVDGSACSLVLLGPGWGPQGWLSRAVIIMSHVVTVPELLDGHTVLDIECLDREAYAEPAISSVN